VDGKWLGALESARDLIKAWREDGVASKVAWTSDIRCEATLESGAKDLGVCLLMAAALVTDLTGDALFNGLAGDMLIR
jgi:hypothetical protein